MKPYTNMSSFHTAILIILNIIKPCCSSLDDKVREPLIGIKRIQTKENTELKVIKPHENYEYPGNSYMAFRKISQTWNSYYSCLRTDFEHKNERKPVIIQIIQGQFTSMKCSHCQRPYEENANVEWRYKPLTSDMDDPDEPEVLDLAPQMKLSHKMTLKIYNARVGYAGLYVCYHGNSTTSVYILEVVQDQSMALLEKPFPVNDTIKSAEGTPLEVYYLWSKWTECSACDEVGKKFRYGTCMIKPKDPVSDLMSRYANPSIQGFFRRNIGRMRSRSKKINKRQDNNKSDAKEIDSAITILNKFLYGIPCTSKLLPPQYRSLIQELNKTGTAVLVEYCKIDCPQSSIFQLVDPHGKIIETANNTAGIYSSFQDIPKAFPEVERKTITAKFKDNIVIECPGNLITDIPVTWMLDKQSLIPELIAEESNGRITIDLLHRLHIERARPKDSQVYSCWERDQLAGTVILNVEKVHLLGYNHHTVLVGLFSIALTFIYVGIKLLSREIKLRKRLTA